MFFSYILLVVIFNFQDFLVCYVLFFLLPNLGCLVFYDHFYQEYVESTTKAPFASGCELAWMSKPVGLPVQLLFQFWCFYFLSDQFQSYVNSI